MRVIMTSVTDKQWAALTGTPVVNRAAQRRAEAAERQRLCTLLALPFDCCCTTGELAKFALELTISP